MRSNLLYRIVFLVTLYTLGFPAIARGEASFVEDIKILDGQIETLSEQLNRDQNKRSDLLILLSQSEKALEKLENDIRQMQSTISDKEEELENILVNQLKILQDVEESRAEVSRALQQIWILGRRSEIQLLLSNQDPSTLSRNMGFFRFILSSQIRTIKAYETRSAELDAGKVKLERSRTSLSSKRKTLKLSKASLVKLSEMRSGILEKLNKNILAGQEQLSILQANRAKLEDLLNQLGKNQLSEANGSFLSMKGKLPWPLIGEIRNDFGTSRHGGKMRWQGVMISSNDGQKVHAIHHGQVVYADMFRGLGLLAIIDHADGFMSLYAHNSSLERNLGEWVTPGMEIATVGKSGWNEETSLYFEIRRDGKPTDPMLWCK